MTTPIGWIVASLRGVCLLFATPLEGAALKHAREVSESLWEGDMITVLTAHVRTCR